MRVQRLEDRFQDGFVFATRQNLQRLQQRHARVQQGGQLPGELRDVAR